MFQMDSVVVNGIRYKVVKATKQEFIEMRGCDEDDYPDYEYCFCLEAPSIELVIRSRLSMVRRLHRSWLW